MTGEDMEGEYLGDGVYASFDGYHLVLDLRAQGPDRICLEPPVLKNLIYYAERLGMLPVRKPGESK